MAKFVTFDDGFGQFNFRAIFPATATKKEIIESVRRKVKRNLSDRGLEKEDFEWENLKDFTTITNMKEGVFYEPEFSNSWDN